MQKMTLGILLTASLIAGCQHHNPLSAHSTRKTTRFLVLASIEASEKLRLNLSELSARNLYINCLDGAYEKMVSEENVAVIVDCNKVYEAIVDYAEHYELPDFKGVRIVDLTDEKAFEPYRDEYVVRTDFGNLEH